MHIYCYRDYLFTIVTNDNPENTYTLNSLCGQFVRYRSSKVNVTRLLITNSVLMALLPVPRA